MRNDHMILSDLFNYTSPAASGHRKPRENQPKHKEKGQHLGQLALEPSCSPSWCPLYSKQKGNSLISLHEDFVAGQKEKNDWINDQNPFQGTSRGDTHPWWPEGAPRGPQGLRRAL